MSHVAETPRVAHSSVESILDSSPQIPRIPPPLMPFRRVLSIGLVGLLALLSLPWGVATTRAETGGELHLPLPGRKVRSGWSIDIETYGIATNGYRPVRVTATLLPVGAVAKGERSLRIELRPRDWYSQRRTQVVKFLDVAQGTSSGTCTMLLPQDGELHAFDVDIYEDGVRLDDLSGENLGMTAWGASQWSELRPGILVVDSKAPAPRDRVAASMRGRTEIAAKRKAESLPDIRPLASLTNEAQAGLTFVDPTHPTDPVLLDTLQQWTRLSLLPPSILPETWLEFSTCDVIVLPLSDLREIVAKRPKVWEAIRDWTIAGRTLIVYDVGKDYSRLDALEQLAGIPPLPRAAEIERRGWQPPRREAFHHQVGRLTPGGNSGVVYQSIGAFGGRIAVASTLPTPAAPPAVPTNEELNAQQREIQEFVANGFVLRPWGLGTVVAIGAEQPFPGTVLFWNGLFNSVPDNNWGWATRQGMTLRRTNLDFWGAWIPGIGKAPVTSFLILISVFVVLIGPFNYFWLRNRKRLYLMLVTVPVGAMLINVTLLSYAILSDGLGMRVRQRSFSWIDQRSGVSTTWSRQSYYAGLAPSRGLLFPNSVSVFPLEPFPNKTRYAGGSRTVEWTDEGQRLASGYLASRTLQQFVVNRTGPTDLRLDITASGSPDRRLRVVNRLGSPVEGLLVKDETGKLWWSDGGTDGSELGVSELPSLDEARSKLTDLITAHPLEAPEGVNNLLMASRNYNNFYYGNDGDMNAASTTAFVSVLETGLRGALAVDVLPAGSYVAIVSNSPLAPLGVQQYREEASLHVIWGQW